MISGILSPNMTVNNMINNGFYDKSETFGGNGRRTPITVAGVSSLSGLIFLIPKMVCHLCIESGFNADLFQ